MRKFRKNSIINIIYTIIYTYPAPTSLSYHWNYGVYGIAILACQIITGIVLSFFYAPDVALAFDSVDRITRYFTCGWLIRSIHANGASMFFIVIYLHTLRGIYYGSYMQPRRLLWTVGVILLLLMIITAFIGYVLPWGQMSYWGAIVITNLVTVIPVVGKDILEWFWGGGNLNSNTVKRFFSLHYIFPFVMLAFVGIHISLLHEHGSSTPLGVRTNYDKLSFNPYYIIKDSFGVLMLILFASIFVYFKPDMLGHPDNFLMANPMATPARITPEWYFLPFYAILRTIPEKTSGILIMFSAILVLFLVPILFKPAIRSMRFQPLTGGVFFAFIINTFTLGWVGTRPIATPYYEMGWITMTLYFAYFFIIGPLTIWFDRYVWEQDLITYNSESPTSSFSKKKKKKKANSRYATLWKEILNGKHPLLVIRIIRVIIMFIIIFIVNDHIDEGGGVE